MPKSNRKQRNATLFLQTSCPVCSWTSSAEPGDIRTAEFRKKTHMKYMHPEINYIHEDAHIPSCFSVRKSFEVSTGNRSVENEDLRKYNEFIARLQYSYLTDKSGNSIANKK